MQKIIIFILAVLFYFPCYSQLEIPSNAKNCVFISHKYYSMCFSNNHRQPSWIALRLNYDMLHGEADNEFYNVVDSNIFFKFPVITDYNKSGYKAGKLVSSNYMRINETALKESNYLSTFSPMIPEFYNGIWEEAEKWILNKAKYVTSRDSVFYLIIGPIFNEDPVRIGKNEISVPDYFFQIIYNPIDRGQTAGIGMLFKNKPYNKTLSEASVFVSIDSVEAITGLDFFPEMEDKRQKQIEANQFIKLSHDGGVIMEQVDEN